jgi:hypothetical protein
MKWILILLLSIGVAAAQAPTPAVSPVPSPVLPQWETSKVPWDVWFKDNALVSDKTKYVHFFWNAQDFRGNFEVKDKKKRLADAALQLVARLTPADAKADLMKVDIVYVLERDTYGQPKWDSLQQVAHLEFSKAKALAFIQKKAVLSDGVVKKLFGKFQVF